MGIIRSRDNHLLCERPGAGCVGPWSAAAISTRPGFRTPLHKLDDVECAVCKKEAMLPLGKFAEMSGSSLNTWLFRPCLRRSFCRHDARQIGSCSTSCCEWRFNSSQRDSCSTWRIGVLHSLSFYFTSVAFYATWLHAA